MVRLTTPAGGEGSPWYSLDGFGGYLKLRILNIRATKLTDAIYKELNEGTLNAASLRWFTSKQLTALKEKIKEAKQSEPDKTDGKIAGVVKEALSFTRKDSRQSVLMDILTLTESESEDISSATQGPRPRGNILYEEELESRTVTGDDVDFDEETDDTGTSVLSGAFEAPSHVKGASDTEEEVSNVFDDDITQNEQQLKTKFNQLENTIDETKLDSNLLIQWTDLSSLKDEIDQSDDPDDLLDLLSEFDTMIKNFEKDLRPQHFKK